MNYKKALQFLLGFILSGGLFVLSVYLTDLLNSRVALFLGIALIFAMGFFIQKRKIKPLTIGFWIGFIPIAIIFIGFIVFISSLH